MGKISKAAKDVVQSLRNLDDVVKNLGQAATRTEKALARVDMPGTRQPPGSPIQATPNPVGLRRPSPQLLQRVDQRAKELQNRLPEGARGRVTIGYGVGHDNGGKMRNVVGSSEDGGYLRREVREALDSSTEEQAKFVGPKMHAEERIIEYMNRNDIKPEAIGAGRPICNQCEPIIDAAGALPASELKGAPPRG